MASPGRGLRRAASPGTTRTGSTLRGELDQTRPFTRPMAASPRRGAPLPVPAAPAGPTSLPPAEADAVMAHAADLAEADTSPRPLMCLPLQSRAAPLATSSQTNCASGWPICCSWLAPTAGHWPHSRPPATGSPSATAQTTTPPWNAATTRRSVRRRLGRIPKHSPRSARSSPTGHRQPVMGRVHTRCPAPDRPAGKATLDQPAGLFIQRLQRRILLPTFGSEG